MYALLIDLYGLHMFSTLDNHIPKLIICSAVVYRLMSTACEARKQIHYAIQAANHNVATMPWVWPIYRGRRIPVH